MESAWTFWADVTPLLEEDIYRKAYQSVPQFRREKADKIRFAGDRALSIGAWRLYMLASEYLEADEGHPFNLSHSGRYALVSIAPKGEKAGCDVEYVKDERKKMAKRFFCQSEYEWITAQPDEEQADAFYRLWVLKESFVKATRYGMKLGLDTFEFDMEKQENPVLKKQPEFIGERYYFSEVVLGEGKARAAVCTTCPVIEKVQQIALF